MKREHDYREFVGVVEARNERSFDSAVDCGVYEMELGFLNLML